MKELYHYHITIGDCTSEQLIKLGKHINAKPTTIDLYNSVNTQKDRMLTKYGRDLQVLEEVGLLDIQKVNLLGFNVKRFKLERVYKELPSNVVGKYLEVHIKVKDKEGLPDYERFSLSKNPSESCTRFYNCRIHQDKDIPYFKEIIGLIPYIGIQYESVIKDTNDKIDKWWAV